MYNFELSIPVLSTPSSSCLLYTSNPVLATLHPSIGAILYKGYVSFAERIAKASGGILSFFTIGPEEKKWIGLPMLTPIVYKVEEDEEE